MRLAPCAPVLARPDGTTQIGTARPVRLAAISETARPVVLAAETISLGVKDYETLGQVGRDLRAAGLLISDPKPIPGTIAIFGAGRIGLELGATLAACGITVGFSDRRPAYDEPDLYPRRSLATTCAGGASWAIKERIPHARVVDPSDPTLAVVVSLGGAARHVTGRWEHDNVPHLIINVDEAGVTVGPLVVPGVTACGRCLALERTDDDPAWPALLDQLSSRAPRPDPELVPEVVATAARLLMTHLRGGRPSNEAWRIQVGIPAAQGQFRPRRDCGCGAA